MAGDEGWAEPVEIVATDETTAEVGGRPPVDWHRVIRTGAAVVAALSLLWMGRSMADERAQVAADRCTNDLSSILWRYENAANRGGRDLREPPAPREVVEETIALARGCGDDLLADAIEFEYITSYEDEDD